MQNLYVTKKKQTRLNWIKHRERNSFQTFVFYQAYFKNTYNGQGIQCLTNFSIMVLGKIVHYFINNDDNTQQNNTLQNLSLVKKYIFVERFFFFLRGQPVKITKRYQNDNYYLFFYIFFSDVTIFFIWTHKYTFYFELLYLNMIKIYVFMLMISYQKHFDCNYVSKIRLSKQISTTRYYVSRKFSTSKNVLSFVVLSYIFDLLGESESNNNTQLYRNN